MQSALFRANIKPPVELVVANLRYNYKVFYDKIYYYKKTLIMANKKRDVYKPKPMTEGKRNLIQGILQEYEIKTAEDIQDALKALLSGTIQDMKES